jgi:sulfatase maturation enzyme AslB (radical SAM superfamily)
MLRDDDNLKGKCGCCEFRHVCMGCRARAFAATGDFLAEEPFCVYQPGTSNRMIRETATAGSSGRTDLTQIGVATKDVPAET